MQDVPGGGNTLCALSTCANPQSVHGPEGRWRELWAWGTNVSVWSSSVSDVPLVGVLTLREAVQVWVQGVCCRKPL